MSRSSKIVIFPRHKLTRCDCGESHCPICAGGLAHCTSCGGAEGTLPTHCPQSLMSDETEAAVYAGSLDFIDGAWVGHRLVAESAS